MLLYEDQMWLGYSRSIYCKILYKLLKNKYYFESKFVMCPIHWAFWETLPADSTNIEGLKIGKVNVCLFCCVLVHCNRVIQIAKTVWRRGVWPEAWYMILDSLPPCAFASSMFQTFKSRFLHSNKNWILALLQLIFC